MQTSNMNTAPPPRISIECEGEDVEQLSELHKHYIDGYSSPPSRSSKDSSLEGIASDAFAILLQKALPSLDSSHRTASSTTARARSHTDSVTVFSSSTWHSTPPSQSSHLPPQPKSFSSSCRRSAPIPAFILPCTTPTRNRQQASSSDKLDVFGTLSGLAAPATPLTAASIEELTPGLAQLRRAFPLPPLRKEETTDELQTPTLKSSMAEQQQEDALFFVSHRLPGAFESFDSLDTLHHVDDSGASMTARQDRTSARHPGAALQECPRTPTEQLYHHRRSSSYRSTSSFKPSPGSTSATSSSPSLQKKRSKRTLRNKRSKASFRSMEIVGEDSNTLQEGIYEPSSGYDFRSCPASPSMSQQQQSAQRPTHPPRSASRGSWRSRYPRPDTAMSTVTTAETVYEDAVDHFSGDEADAEEDASEVPASRWNIRLPWSSTVDVGN